MLFEGPELPTLFFIVWAWIAQRDGLAAALTLYDGGKSAFTFSTGQTYIDNSDPSREVRLSWSPPKRLGAFTPVFDFSLSERQGVFAGIGLAWRKEFTLAEIPMFIGVQSVPGFWDSGGEPDLGSQLIFRSSAEIGVKLGEYTWLSLATDHRSNGNVSAVNPGMEVLSFRFTRLY